MGLKMKAEDVKAFLEWWDKNKLPDSTDRDKYIASCAWEAAINHEQNKAIRTYRWDGVIR